MVQIWDLFVGYEKAHGRYDVRRVNDAGKNEGPARTVSEPLLPRHWDIHLTGSGPGVGVIPLRQDNTILWACIDLDINNIDHAALEKKCHSLKMPLVICRSKSGGAHCFLFFKDPVEAKPVMDILSFWASTLGYGGAEVFPKQSSRYDENDIGNWLNMPYYHVDRTTRYCVHKGEELELNQFLEYAESMRTTLEDIEEVQENLSFNSNGQPLNDGLFEEGPPCLQRIFANGGFPDGTRNEGMYNIAVYLRKKNPDDWADQMAQYNLELCDPPLTLSDINVIVRSGQRKDYEYKCRKPPINAYCDRRLCQTRRFGVGENAEGRTRPDVNDVKKVVGDPTLWYMTVGGRRMMFMTDEMLSQNKWKAKVAEAINRVPSTIPQPRWDKWLDEILSTCEIEYAPVDATIVGQFKSTLESYLYGQARTTTKEQLTESASPYHTEEEIWFRLQGLMRFLRNNGHDFKSMNHLSEMLKSPEIGAQNKEISIKGKTHNIWKIKKVDRPSDNNPDVKFGTEEF